MDQITNSVVMIPANRIGVVDWNYVIVLIAPSIIAMIFAFVNLIKAKTAVMLAQTNARQINEVVATVHEVKNQNAVVEARVAAVAQLSTDRHEDVMHKLDAQTAEILTNGGGHKSIAPSMEITRNLDGPNNGLPPK